MYMDENNVKYQRQISSQEFVSICNGSLMNHLNYKSFYSRDNNGITHITFSFTEIKGTVSFNTDKQYKFPILIHFCKFLNTVNFQTGIFDKSFQIIETNLTDVEFGENIVFKNNIEINECITSGEIKVLGGNYQSDFDLNINGCDTLPSVRIEKGYFKKLYIGGNNSFNTNIQILNIQTAGIEGTIFIAGHRKTTNRYIGVPAKYTTYVENIYINNFSSNLKLYIESINLTTISFSSYVTSESLKIHAIKPLKTKTDTEFKIQDSNFGDAEISTAFLNLFDEVNIRDSYVSDVNFVNTLWPSEITSYEQHGSSLIKLKKLSKEYYHKNRDVYRQLKYASNKYGDLVTSQYFHSKEMKAYKKSLEWKKKFGTVIILVLSELTSNFGLSIRRPLTALLVGHFILFLIALLSNAIEVSSANDFAYKFFYLINPIRDYKFQLNGTIIIDIFMRGWSSYMIYNFIRASRRYIK